MTFEYDREFLPLLEPFDDIDMHRSPQVIYGMWADFRLAYLNSAWFQFSTANFGDPEIPAYWSLGRSLADTLPAELAPFYIQKFRECLKSGRHWSHDYECSSDEIYRKYHQTTYPLAGRGLLVVNSLRVELPRDSTDSAPASAAELSAYYDENRYVHQCCHCRRVQRLDTARQWDFVPLFIRNPEPRTTHGLCAHCLNHYYPEAKPYL